MKKYKEGSKKEEAGESRAFEKKEDKKKFPMKPKGKGKKK